MAKQTINIDTPNSGDGTPARDAFDICNQNFTELYEGAAVAEGTAILSTGEVGGTKFLREDGDGTSSWQPIPATEGTAILSTGEVGGTKFLREDGDGTCSWQEVAGGGAFSADAQTQITPTTPIVLDEATGDEVALDLSATINKATSGNYSLIYADVTETSAPGSADYLIDLKVGGSTAFSVANNGNSTILNGSNAINLTATTGQIEVVYSNAAKAGIGRDFRAGNYTGVWVSSDSSLMWNSGTNLSTGSFDLFLYRDAANTLALRNSTNAQTFNVYNTYTDASNYERGFMKWNTNVLEIGTEAAGTGTARDLKLTSASGDVLSDSSLTFTNTFDGIIWTGGAESSIVNDGGGRLNLSCGETIGNPAVFNFLTTNGVTSGSAFYFATNANSDLRSTSAQQNFFYLSPEVDQSGTAGYTCILLDVTETATGSGTNRLLDLQVASTTKFAVENDGTPIMGTHSAIGAETVTGYITIKDAGGTTRKLAVVS